MRCSSGVWQKLPNTSVTKKSLRHRLKRLSMHMVKFCVRSPFKHNKAREKGRDLTQSYGKSPYTKRKIRKATWQQKTATKNYDYTTIADRLKTVSWSNDSYHTGVVKPGSQPSHLPPKLCNQKDTHNIRFLSFRHLWSKWYGPIIKGPHAVHFMRSSGSQTKLTLPWLAKQVQAKLCSGE